MSRLAYDPEAPVLDARPDLADMSIAAAVRQAIGESA